MHSNLQLLPRGWLLHRANNKSPEASPGQGEDSKASWVNQCKSNNQPAVGDGLLPLISGKIGDGSLFWGLQGLVLPLNHSTILLTSSREDLSDSRVLSHPNHPKKVEPNVRDVLLAVSSQLEKLTNFEAVKSDSVNLWPIQPWLLLQLGFLPYPPNSDHFLRVTGGWFADGVGGAAAGVNGFLTSENSGTSTWIGAKRPKRYIKCIRIFNYCPVVASPSGK